LPAREQVANIFVEHCGHEFVSDSLTGGVPGIIGTVANERNAAGPELVSSVQSQIFNARVS
jgi:hypothetical protein